MNSEIYFCADQHAVWDLNHCRALHSRNLTFGGEHTPSSLPAPPPVHLQSTPTGAPRRAVALLGQERQQETLGYNRRLGPGPSLGDGAGLTMVWDESLGMERQSSDKMVARDRGMAAIALVSLLPPALRQSHANVPRDGGTQRANTDLCPRPWRASVSGQAGCKSQGTSPHAVPPWGWH